MVERVRSLTCARALVPITRKSAFVVAALAAVFFATACTSSRPKLEAPTVTLESVHILRIAEGKATLTLDLRLSNPNAFDLAVDAVAVDVTLDGRPAASVHSVHVEPLPAGSEAKVQLAGLVDVAAVVTALMTLGQQLPVEYTAKGSATLHSGTVLPFASKGQVPVARFDRAFGTHP